jgi:hypothetical protein
MRAAPRLCIKLYSGIRLTTEENHGKTSVGVAEKHPTADPAAGGLPTSTCPAAREPLLSCASVAASAINLFISAANSKRCLRAHLASAMDCTVSRRVFTLFSVIYYYYYYYYTHKILQDICIPHRLLAR